MNTTTPTTLSAVGRWSVALGTTLALACAIAFAYGAPGLRSMHSIGAPDIVRLDPVVVTISKDRFDAIRAEAQGATMIGAAPKKAAGQG